MAVPSPTSGACTRPWWRKAGGRDVALGDIQAMVDSLARDGGGEISAADRDAGIAAAVQRYSLDRPYRDVADVDAEGTLLPLPAAFESDFSVVTEIEAPAGQIPPRKLSAESWYTTQTPDGIEIRTRAEIGSPGKARIRFTRRQVVDAITDTVPVHDREAVACWAAAFVLQGMASQFAADRQSTIQADSVDHAAKSNDFARRAAELRKVYYTHLGIDPQRQAPASATVSVRPTGRLGLLQRGQE